jgi:trehalose 6-phosphate synthase
MGRLIVICNRANPPTKDRGGAVGGVAIALAATLREQGGLWFGWSGKTVERFSGSVTEQDISGVRVATIDFDATDAEEYLTGFANRTLWPLFHYRLASYASAMDEGYRRIARRFAESVRPLIASGDAIWVHDYHLIPLGAALRRLGVSNPIGFFLHIPWPTRELLKTLPQHRALVDDLFAYDLAGFHTEEWRQAFCDHVRHEGIGSVGSDGNIRGFGRSLRTGVFPVGIDAADVAKDATSEAGLASYRSMQTSLHGLRLILGVDRLDYPKGLEERFLTFEQLLDTQPQLSGSVQLLQIAPPSTDAVGTYDEIRLRLEKLSGRINGRFATADWSPIRFVNRMHSRNALAGLYRSAAVGMMTPLRDGMNLVAKEYVAAQDPADPGVLILSRFAGAAAQMREALIVNPFDRAEVCDAIRTALNMEKPDRIRLWETLMNGVMRDDVAAWREGFLAALYASRKDRRTALP